jgi:lipid-A-disaccharide synthase
VSVFIPVNTQHSALSTQHSKLFFSAGDVSGDIHSAEVARRILELHPGWKIDAVCGPHLREAGARQIGDSSGYGVIGFASAMALLPKVLLLQRRVLHYLKTEKPDAVLLCDWGAFNGRLLPHLKKLQIPVLYYFPPRSWQKTGSGGLAIAPLVDAVATPFEWSARRLREAGCNAEWVGHPLLETVRRVRESGVAREENLIALLPGSRALEWKWIAPHMAQAARLILEQKPHTRFIAVVPKGAAPQVQKYFSGICEVIEGNATKVLLQAQAAIVKSGTATLEAAVCDTPQVVAYDVPPLLHWQIKLTGLAKKVPFVAMPNIIAGRKIIPELLGEKCRGPLIAEKVLLLLDDEKYRIKMQQNYAEVRRALGEELPLTATEKTVRMLEQLLKNHAV